MKHSILMHEPDDDVGVAVEDLQAGADVGAVTLEGKPVGTIRVMENIPLGHKIAMRDLAKGKKVIEYGRPIGQATRAAASGTHVHTHNLKTLRWQA